MFYENEKQETSEIVSPSPGDRVKQIVQSTLGPYDNVKHLLEEPKQLLGYDGAPPPSPAPSQVQQPPPVHQPSSAAPGKPTHHRPPPHEFKKPPTSSHPIRPINHHHNTSASRGGFVKPADGKPGHGGRGFYPGQPLKHSGTGDHRSNGLISKVPPPAPYHHRPTIKSSLPRLHIDNNPMQTKDYNNGCQNDVENILKEMTDLSMMTPLTAIAATPRKEVETKFNFNPETFQGPVVKHVSPVLPPISYPLSPPKPESPPPFPVSPPPATPGPQKSRLLEGSCRERGTRWKEGPLEPSGRKPAAQQAARPGSQKHNIGINFGRQLKFEVFGVKVDYGAIRSFKNLVRDLLVLYRDTGMCGVQ
ncbi:hypothetical protein AAG570_007970 [Ranatra chinensis]|uniref:Non-specific serine/threonine protein kinase n=1 Tax=Ranatra chinensis TaxID=642074 RepID=A0ABD0XTF5_9HEMI